MKRALISVYDKSGVVDFARVLAEAGVELVASGGTAKVLRESGLEVTEVADVTGFGPMLGGRVKTLHPAIFAPILARSADDLSTSDWEPIDCVAVNLYPFQEAAAKPGASSEDIIEMIDIGGAALLRAAAKNAARVTVICSPDDYEKVAAEIAESGSTSMQTRRALAAKAFGLTSAYDGAIANFFAEDRDEGLPQSFNLALPKAKTLRYGENPHQPGALYGTSGPLGGKLIAGERELSYNNLIDLDAAWQAAKQVGGVVVVKHACPTGLAVDEDPAAALRAAIESDALSAFGGVIGSVAAFDEAMVEALEEMFVEVIAAPAFTPGAVEMLQSGRKNCRLVEVPLDFEGSPYEFRSIQGGMLAQRRDDGDPEGTEWRVVTAHEPNEEEMESLKFAWKAVQSVKSNGIVLAVGTKSVGVSGGQPSRVDAVHIAASRADERAKGSVLASDAFFPFPDGLTVAAAAGVRAVVQPGGSRNDEAVIEAADDRGLAMVFTGVQHFRH